MPVPQNRGKERSRAYRGPGGAGSGPALLELPASGCPLPVPDMPSGREWSERERERWQELWESPQAGAWDDSASGTVAALVIYESALMAGSASAWQAAEMRHAAESLGLTPRGMAALGWKIVDR